MLSKHTLDHSKSVCKKIEAKSTVVISSFSNVRLFCSFHTVHMRHNRTIFQISKEFFPSQFHQPNKRSATVPGMTHRSPKVWKTTLHSPNATSQWSNKCPTVSPSHQHIQHRPTKHTPLLRRLS